MSQKVVIPAKFDATEQYEKYIEPKIKELLKLGDELDIALSFFATSARDVSQFPEESTMRHRISVNAFLHGVEFSIISELMDRMGKDGNIFDHPVKALKVLMECYMAVQKDMKAYAEGKEFTITDTSLDEVMQRDGEKEDKEFNPHFH